MDFKASTITTLNQTAIRIWSFVHIKMQGLTP